MNVSDRIRLARKHAGLNQAQLGTALGLESHAAVSRYEAGKRSPELDQLVKIAKICGVDPGWLILGQGAGPDGVVEPPEDAVPDPVPDPMNDPAKGRLVEMGGAEITAIPRFDAGLSAGHGSLIDPNAEPLGFVFYETQWLHAVTKTTPDHLAVVQVDGDSMNNALFHGDWVLIDRSQRKVNREGIYALAVGDVCWVKRISLNLREKLVKVMSDNPVYGTQELPEEELTILGRVVWIVGRKVV